MDHFPPLPHPHRTSPPSPSQIIDPMPHSTLQNRFPSNPKYSFELKSDTSSSTFLTTTFLGRRSSHLILTVFNCPNITLPVLSFVAAHHTLTMTSSTTQDLIERITKVTVGLLLVESFTSFSSSWSSCPSSLVKLDKMEYGT